jgi:hypothetical protein
VLAQAVHAASYWYAYTVVKDSVEGQVEDLDRLDRAHLVWVLAAGGFWLALLAAGVVFIVWLCGPEVTLNSSAMDGTGAVAAG